MAYSVVFILFISIAISTFGEGGGGGDIQATLPFCMNLNVYKSYH